MIVLNVLNLIVVVVAHSCEYTQTQELPTLNL